MIKLHPTVVSQIPNIDIKEFVNRVTWIDNSNGLPWVLPNNADVLITGPVDSWRLAPQHPPSGWPGSLSWVHTVSAGVDFYPTWLLDVPTVTCSRGVSATSVAEHVISTLLTYNNPHSICYVRSEQDWIKNSRLVKQNPPTELSGQTLGILGFGAIGRAVANRASALGMKVIAWKKHPTSETCDVNVCLNLKTVIENSDHLVLALPYTPETHHILNTDSLKYAKPTLHIINIARGKLIDQDALLYALSNNYISAATLDVTTPEPLPEYHPLYSHPNVRITPHISWISRSEPYNTSQKFTNNLSRFLSGQALFDVVNPITQY